MSYNDGWAAINLDMPSRVPRTEYSCEMHYELMKAVTGIPVFEDSSQDIKVKAMKKFYKDWNYDFQWGVLIGGDRFGDKRTDMGHAEYAAGGVDYRELKESPYKTVDEVLNYNFEETFGIPDKVEWKKKFEVNYNNSREWMPDAVPSTGVYITLISGFIDLFGWDLLLEAAGEDSVKFGEMTNRYADWMMNYIEALSMSENVPVVMIHDDMVWTSGAIFQPEWYRKYVFPNFKRYFSVLRDCGKKIIFTSDGNYTEFIDDIAETGVHGFVLEPMTDMAYIAEKYGKTHVFIGNADTRILLYGSKNAIYNEVERCMSIGKKCPGFFMAVGNHIPPNTPVENAIYYNDIYEKLSKR